MPNHVINRLEFDCSKERLNEILAAICYDESSDEAEITGPGTIADSAEHKMRTSLSRSRYKCNGFEQKKVSGRNANGFTYEYVLEGAEQIGEVLVFQNVNCYYTLYAYALKENQKVARVIIDSVEDSIHFTNDK